MKYGIKGRIMLYAVIFMMVIVCCACNNKKDIPINQKLDTSEPVTITLCGAWQECRAIENAAQAFKEIYPNCSVEYEYVQNYDESILARLEQAPETVDIFLTGNQQEGSALLPYAQDLFALDGLDLSTANKALIRNFTYKNPDESEKAQIYALPMGGELRGLFVNKTLLQSLGLKVPENVQELLDDCKVLKEAGYIPMNGNPGMFSQRLLYPYVCNLIANADNYQETYDRVNHCEAGVSELFREPMELMYTMVEDGYYNYKYVETEQNMFVDDSEEGIARDFFHIVPEGDSFQKADDTGVVAFMSGMLSLDSTIKKVKEDYHSQIDYEFILAPVSEEGGFAYTSPGHAIAANKNSAHIEWVAEFLNFLFEKEENIQFASDLNYIPNTEDSFETIKEMYEIPENRICDLGQVTFDYDFYGIMYNALMETSKANNPKYMKVDKDGTTVLYGFDYYMQHLEEAFAAQRESGKN